MPPRRSPRSFPLPRNPHRAGHPLRGFWQFMYHLDGVTLRAVLQNADSSVFLTAPLSWPI
jgi:hypothetical protein